MNLQPSPLITSDRSQIWLRIPPSLIISLSESLTPQSFHSKNPQSFHSQNPSLPYHFTVRILWVALPPLDSQRLVHYTYDLNCFQLTKMSIVTSPRWSLSICQRRSRPRSKWPAPPNKPSLRRSSQEYRKQRRKSLKKKPFVSATVILYVLWYFIFLINLT